MMINHIIKAADSRLSAAYVLWVLSCPSGAERRNARNRPLEKLVVQPEMTFPPKMSASVSHKPIENSSSRSASSRKIKRSAPYTAKIAALKRSSLRQCAGAFSSGRASALRWGNIPARGRWPPPPCQAQAAGSRSRSQQTSPSSAFLRKGSKPAQASCSQAPGSNTSRPGESSPSP